MLNSYVAYFTVNMLGNSLDVYDIYFRDSWLEIIRM